MMWAKSPRHPIIISIDSKKEVFKRKEGGGGKKIIKKRKGLGWSPENGKKYPLGKGQYPPGGLSDGTGKQ